MAVNFSEMKRMAEYAASDPRLVVLRTYARAKSLFSKNLGVPLKTAAIYLTFRCDLRCEMCPLWGSKDVYSAYTPETTRTEVTLDEMKKFVDEVSVYQPSILLTGGEPMLYPKWDDLAAYIKQKKLHCNMQTNGSLLSNYAEKIAGLIDYINISLDGLRQSHDTIRGKTGSFDRIIEGLRALEEAKTKKNTPYPVVNVCCTLNEKNYREVGDLLDFLESLDVQIRDFILLHQEFTDQEIIEKYKQKAGHEFDRKEEFWNFFLNENKIPLDPLCGELEHLSGRRGKINLVFRPEGNPAAVKHYYQNPLQMRKNEFRKCPYPWYEVFLTPRGEVWTCPSTRVGNIKEESFSAIWLRVKQTAKSYFLNGKKPCDECLGEVFIYQAGSMNMVKH